MHKWDFLKQIKAELLRQQHAKVIKMVSVRTLLVYLMLKPLLNELAHMYKRKKF